MDITHGEPIKFIENPAQFDLKLSFARNIGFAFSEDILRRYIAKRFPAFLINNSNIKLILTARGIPGGEAGIANSDGKPVNFIECEFSQNDIFMHIGSLLETHPTLGEEYKKAIDASGKNAPYEKRNEVIGKALSGQLPFSDSPEFLNILENDFLDPKSYSLLLHELSHIQLLRIYADPSELEHLPTKSEVDGHEDEINEIIEGMQDIYSIENLNLRSKVLWSAIFLKIYPNESLHRGYFVSKYLSGVQELWVRLIEILSQIEMSKSDTVDEDREKYRYKNYEYMRKPYTPGSLSSSMEAYWRFCILPPTEVLDKLKQMDSYSVQSDLFNREKVINFMRTELLPLMDRDRVEKEWQSFKDEFLTEKVA